MSRKVDEVVEVAIEKLVTGGLGLARHAGLTVLVPLSAPGDRLRVRLVERRASWARGELLEVLQPGPGRRAPPCPHYARCGGCDLQHLDEETQLRLKVEAAIETLARLGGVRLDRPPAVVAGSPWGYRRRAQLHVEAGRLSAGAPGGAGVRIGQHARGSHALVPLDCCPILAPALEAALRALPAQLASAPLAEGRAARLELAAGDDGSWSARLDGDALGAAFGAAVEPVEARVGAFTYRFDAGCFFQAHASMLETLVAAALGPDASASEDRAGEAADLYAGVGLFTLPLAAAHARVHAVESEPAAAAWLAENVARNDALNVSLHAASVEDVLDALPRGLRRVVADPPRTGLSPAVRAGLLSLAPQRLTYVSCDVATLARDLRALAPGLLLESLTLLDLFPQTSHLEAVAQLRARTTPAPPEP